MHTTLRAALAVAALPLLLSACTEDETAPDGPFAPQAAAAAGACGSPAKLAACVTQDALSGHLEALQGIADANDDQRRTGQPGEAATAAYVLGLLSDAGYQVSLSPISFDQWVLDTPPVFEQITPSARTFVEGVDYAVMSHSPSREVTGSLVPVDANSANSGCEAADFAGFPAGAIALMKRGTCQFWQKAVNAQAAGALAAVIFNDGPPDHEGVVPGTLTDSYTGLIPVLGTTYALGLEWIGQPGMTVHIKVDASIVTNTSHNVIAQTRDGDPANVVMLGAHLDAAEGSPGIQDNGSGVAALLEVALQMATVKPKNQVRFAFWSGHEQGLEGSTAYLGGLTQAQKDAIALYIEVESIGAPNYGLFVVDGDGDANAFSAIEKFFADFYTKRGLASEQAEIASNHQAFRLAGIPAGGITTIAGDGVKTVEQQALWGGTAGIAFDPCYHQACDTFDNISLQALDLNADAVAMAAITYAMSTESVNGKKGKGRTRTSSSTSTAASLLPTR